MNVHGRVLHSCVPYSGLFRGHKWGREIARNEHADSSQ